MPDVQCLIRVGSNEAHHEALVDEGIRLLHDPVSTRQAALEIRQERVVKLQKDRGFAPLRTRDQRIAIERCEQFMAGGRAQPYPIGEQQPKVGILVFMPSRLDRYASLQGVVRRKHLFACGQRIQLANAASIAILRAGHMIACHVYGRLLIIQAPTPAQDRWPL
ncbi:MAG TPA: hypothetical protein VGY30_06235 [Solirubrobacteraceae bacterium]|nr:hypothetical protein [Solirubrobacteraceae bacterium]